MHEALQAIDVLSVEHFIAVKQRSFYVIVEVDGAVDRSLPLLVLCECFWQRKYAFLIDISLHEVVKRLQAEISQLILLGKVAHSPNDIHFSRSFHVQSQFLTRLYLYPQPLASQSYEILLPAFALLHNKLQYLGIGIQEFIAEVLDEIFVRIQLFQPASIHL